jgi:NADPH-dependent 2,4-dienoyl-CoA reductase/sulfur reductase-like enzyme
MKNYDVIIIGGGPAAIVTGITVKKCFNDKSILMIKEEAEGLVPCGIPYIFHALGADVDKNKMGPKAFVDMGGEVLVDTVVKVDKDQKQVNTQKGEQFSYNKLVFATGSLPVVPKSLPGHDLDNVYYIKKSYNYIKAINEKLTEAKNIVIVGGGFIGAEVAEQFSYANKNVTLIESESTCFSKAFSPELSQIATDTLNATNVNVKTSCLLKEIKEADGKANKVVLDNGETIDCDAVILSIGYRGNTDLAKEAGLALNKYGDIHVDNYGRTNIKDVSAVGDCAQTFGFLTGSSDVIKLASTATAEARVLGYNMFGVRIKKNIFGTLGVFSTEINGLAMAAAGANEKNAADSGIEIVSSVFTSPDRHPGGFSDTKSITVKLYASPIDGIILGGEVWGGKSAGEIINTISMAIQKSITVYEMASFQMGTHPLLSASPVMNPLVRAAEAMVYKIMQGK